MVTTKPVLRAVARRASEGCVGCYYRAKPDTYKADCTQEAKPYILSPTCCCSYSPEMPIVRFEEVRRGAA